MIKGLILGSWNKSKEATIAFVMAAIIFWGVLQVLEKANPREFHLAIEQKFEKKVLEAESRSKALIAQELEHERRLNNERHSQVMGGMSEVKAEVKTMNQHLIDLLNRMPRTSAFIGGKPCGAHLECL